MCSRAPVIRPLVLVAADLDTLGAARHTLLAPGRPGRVEHAWRRAVQARVEQSAAGYGPLEAIARNEVREL
jgi:hypothetical protein